MNKIAIIGFGAAGYCAAAAARKCDPDALIDVYTDDGRGPYNPMLTTYYVKGAIDYEAMFPFGSLDEIEERLNLCIYRNSAVTGLDGETKTIFLSDGTKAAYDNILISTGAAAFVPPIQGGDLPGVFKMRTAEDGVYLKKLLDSGKIRSGLVVGASWVGIKVVEDLVEHGIPCTLVDGADWAFSIAAFRQTAQRIHRDLEQKGIKLAFGQMLSHIEQEKDGRITAVMKNGCRFTADAIAICIGVRPNAAFLKDSGVAVNRGVLVDERMSTNLPGIYAAGDCCEAFEIQSGERKNIGLWFNARKQGEVAGANMAGRRKAFGGNALLNLAHYLDCDFISIGDVASCRDEDQVYEYEDDRYYIRAVRGEKLKCLNMIGTGESNGVVKSLFIKCFENNQAEMDMTSICHLKGSGFPDSFIDFIGRDQH